MTNARETGKWLQCPKCEQFSGDDWSQCKGVCPVEGSPHYNRAAPMNWGHLIEHTPEEAQRVMNEYRQRMDALWNKEARF